MNVEKMTKKTLESIEMAQNTAIKHNHSQIDTIHLHYGLIEDESGLVSSVLSNIPIDVTQYRSDLLDIIERMPRVTSDQNEIYASRRLNKVLLDAEDEAKGLSDAYISVEHVYLALLSRASGEDKRVFNKYAITKDIFFKRACCNKSEQTCHQSEP